MNQFRGQRTSKDALRGDLWADVMWQSTRFKHGNFHFQCVSNFHRIQLRIEMGNEFEAASASICRCFFGENFCLTVVLLLCLCNEYQIATNCASRLSDYWVPMLLPSFYCRATCACKFATNRRLLLFFLHRRVDSVADTLYTKFVAGNVFDRTWR